MIEAPISPLRRRMIEDMTMRKFAPRTQEGYIRGVKAFSAFLGASPDTASFEDLRRYQLHLASSHAGVPTINHTVTALRFLFTVTLRKPDAAYVGLGADASSARAHDRARRRHLARRRALGRVPARLLPSRPRALAALSAPLPGTAGRRAR